MVMKTKKPNPKTAAKKPKPQDESKSKTPDIPDIPAECPATVRRDDANKAICVEACKMLEVPKRSQRLPAFTKSEVQGKAGFPNVKITCWPDIVEAIERWHWQWNPRKEGGLKIVATQRETRIQLIALTSRAFADAHWGLAPPEPDGPDILTAKSATGHKKEPVKPDVIRITPKDELEELGEHPYPLTPMAQAVASRFIAQNTGKKTAGYGSVEIAKGRLAWRWFQIMDRKVEANQVKKGLMENVLRANGWMPPELTDEPETEPEETPAAAE
jgi:hypothetical protein